MKKFLSIILAVLMVSSLVVSAHAADNRLTIYTAYQEEEAQLVFNAFEKETGIKVDYVRLSAGELYAMVQAEAENPQASVWFGTSVDTLSAAGEAGYLEPYTSPVEAEIPEDLRNPDHYWTGHTLSVTCFATNMEWSKESGINPPTSWAELLDEKYQDNVVTPHPGTSGMAFTWLNGMVALMGEDEAFEYLKKLDKSIIQYTKGGSAPARMAGLGETGVGVCFSCDAQNAINSGYPLEITYPEEGSPYELAGVALIKNGPAAEVENAKKFIDWAVSKEASELFVNNFNRLPANGTVVLPEGMLSADQINVIKYDGAFSSANRARLIARFESDVRNSENVLK